jgi:hypothetical protein
MAKSNEISFKINCPICKERVGKEVLQKTAALFPFDGFFYGDKGMLESFMEVQQRYPDFYQWACDDCLKFGKAILASPKRQNHTHSHPMDAEVPYLAYFDQHFTCRNCSASFLFSKEEQQYWYEELAIYVKARPIYCKPCRKEIRAAKALNTELSELLKDGVPQEAEKLLRIAAIYQKMGHPEKEKHYLTLAQKARR